jgi:hypothetical protein
LQKCPKNGTKDTANSIKVKFALTKSAEEKSGLLIPFYPIFVGHIQKYKDEIKNILSI